MVWLSSSVHVPRSVANPGARGPCLVSSRIVDIGGLETYTYYPSANQCGDEIAAPYPAIMLAHGFSMFGIIDEAASHAGNGEHLASWGYVVAIPKLPDSVDQRITDVQDVLSYLQTEASRQGSLFYEKIDVDRLALAGHSFGGATVLAVAARDGRVKALVAKPGLPSGRTFPGGRT